MSARRELPALHVAAGNLSAAYQRKFLWLVRGEYGFLLAAAVLAMEFAHSARYYLAYAAVLLAGLGVMLVRSTMKPEQQWYRARAAAESVKTMAWRYMMRAHPYDDPDEAAAKGKFRGYLRELMKTNKVWEQGGSQKGVGDDQVTPSMQEVRSLPWDRRRDVYLDDRVRDQEQWYKRKSAANARTFRLWVWASVAAYVFAIGMALLRVAEPEWHHLPIEPLILFASSIVGWVQIKKHSELAASYRLTATEIGLAREEASEIKNEEDFSEFVNNTELVFSREHTQWVARQETAG